MVIKLKHILQLKQLFSIINDIYLQNNKDQHKCSSKDGESSIVAKCTEADLQLQGPSSRIRFLERQNYQLQKIVTAQKDYVSERSSYAFTNSFI